MTNLEHTPTGRPAALRDKTRMHRRLLKPLLLVTIVLIVPVVLLAIRGESFASELERWRSSPPPPATLAALVVAILAVDVVLPVPSGPVSTLAGSQLGLTLGTAASTLGMTLGATIAFALARGFTWTTRQRQAVEEKAPSAEAEQACRDHGPWLLVITRPLPIVAEAAVLLVGGLRMPWRTFLPPVIASNLVLSATYALLGQQAAAHGWLPLAVCTSIALPLAIAIACRRHLQGR